MTVDEAKSLHLGQIIFHTLFTNADGSPRRWRVNGAVKTWKTRPDDVRVPIKHGMWDYDYVWSIAGNGNLDDFAIKEEECKTSTN